MPTYDARCPKCGLTDEISKPMSAPMPKCSACGAQLRRVYTLAAPVHYKAAGFYETDVAHFEKQVGKDKADQVRRYAEDVDKRKRQGRLTDYEKALEAA